MNRAIWIGLAVAVVVAAIFIFLSNSQSTAQTAPAAAAGAAVSFTPLASGNDSSVASAANYRVIDANDFAKLWAMTDAKGTPPAVDFTKDDVLAVFAGTEPTAGYAIAISSIEDGTARQVSITLTAPAEGCAVAEATTAPYEIVEVPATMLTLTHEDATATKPCD